MSSWNHFTSFEHKVLKVYIKKCFVLVGEGSQDMIVLLLETIGGGGVLRRVGGGAAAFRFPPVDSSYLKYLG